MVDAADSIASWQSRLGSLVFVTAVASIASPTTKASSWDPVILDLRAILFRLANWLGFPQFLAWLLDSPLPRTLPIACSEFRRAS